MGCAQGKASKKAVSMAALRGDLPEEYEVYESRIENGKDMRE